MNSNAEELVEFFKQRNTKCQCIGDNIVAFWIKREKIENYQVLIQFMDIKDTLMQTASVAVNLCKFPAEKIEAMYKICNKLNQHYAGVSFYVSENINTVRVSMVSFMLPGSVATNVYSDIITIVRIIDEAYPQIMKEIWS